MSQNGGWFPGDINRRQEFFWGQKVNSTSTLCFCPDIESIMLMRGHHPLQPTFALVLCLDNSLTGKSLGKYTIEVEHLVKTNMYN